MTLNYAALCSTLSSEQLAVAYAGLTDGSNKPSAAVDTRAFLVALRAELVARNRR